ncbi:gliding motility-associated ABC transporter permease protein GldF [compost metagenome]
MRTFAEERKEGTYVLLGTRPVTDTQIILAKYLACSLLVLFALIPTLIYYYSLYVLGQPEGNIDTGAVAGSYLGLLLLGATFTAVGIFASSLTKNQVIAFVISVFLCFFLFSGFEALAKLFEFEKGGDILLNLGIAEHYQSISRGIIDTRDLVYFASFIIVFLLLTKYVIGRRAW